MRVKTLGVLVMTVLSVLILLYWLTDGSRRATATREEEVAQLAYGKVVFANDPTNPSSAGCARCHGADGQGGPVPNDPNHAIAPDLHGSRVAQRLKVNPDYVHLVVSYGGVVVSGNVNSPDARLEHRGRRPADGAADQCRGGPGRELGRGGQAAERGAEHRRGELHALRGRGQRRPHERVGEAHEGHSAAAAPTPRSPAS